jgi:hypothetical protein
MCVEQMRNSSVTHAYIFLSRSYELGNNKYHAASPTQTTMEACRYISKQDLPLAKPAAMHLYM